MMKLIIWLISNRIYNHHPLLYLKWEYLNIKKMENNNSCKHLILPKSNPANLQIFIKIKIKYRINYKGTILSYKKIIFQNQSYKIMGNKYKENLINKIIHKFNRYLLLWLVNIKICQIRIQARKKSRLLTVAN